ncbi:uncharacterized protein PV06_00119 [Exophiala oligosperma]|uniref:Uncharacterized protein n=1 Tax=Exophiala oligosperma TaxID=215243 RepID=A0A0D2CBV6_9EURO|nr:uncharacterized protein PV06_00119 [Exophiala oligosperma]KIW47422.1 hypothetical protein PV06_00119 [Exophiala oligosperma]
MTASTSSTEPSAISNRLKTQGIANGPNPKGMVTPPASMSKMSRSAELDEYTASMRNYLAGVENGRGQSTRDRRAESISSNSNADSSGSEREKSPEFQWMDLAAVRRAHGTVDLNRLPNSNGVSKSVRTKQVNRPRSPTIGIPKDSRHYLHQHRQRETRSISPGIEGVKKKHISHARRSQLHLQRLGVSSSQKDCT